MRQFKLTLIGRLKFILRNERLTKSLKKTVQVVAAKTVKYASNKKHLFFEELNFSVILIRISN